MVIFEPQISKVFQCASNYDNLTTYMTESFFNMLLAVRNKSLTTFWVI